MPLADSVLCTDDNPDEGEKKEAEKFGTFWKEFGRAIKLGIIEDAANRPRLAKLLRVKTSADPEKLVSLDDYISRMKEDQKQIFYLTGAHLSLDACGCGSCTSCKPHVWVPAQGL